MQSGKKKMRTSCRAAFFLPVRVTDHSVPLSLHVLGYSRLECRLWC